MRWRYAGEAAAEIKAADPGSAVTERMIRNLIKRGVIPAISPGIGTRKMVDLDLLLQYLEDPEHYESRERTGSIRAVNGHADK